MYCRDKQKRGWYKELEVKIALSRIQMLSHAKHRKAAKLKMPVRYYPCTKGGRRHFHLTSQP